MGMKLPTPQKAVYIENSVGGQHTALRKWLLGPPTPFWELVWWGTMHDQRQPCLEGYAPAFPSPLFSFLSSLFSISCPCFVSNMK